MLKSVIPVIGTVAVLEVPAIPLRYITVDPLLVIVTVSKYQVFAYVFEGVINPTLGLPILGVPGGQNGT